MHHLEAERFCGKRVMLPVITGKKSEYSLSSLNTSSYSNEQNFPTFILGKYLNNIIFISLKISVRVIISYVCTTMYPKIHRFTSLCNLIYLQFKLSFYCAKDLSLPIFHVFKVDIG